MNKTKIKKLEKNGWRVGTVTVFLDLDRNEERVVDAKAADRRKPERA